MKFSLSRNKSSKTLRRMPGQDITPECVTWGYRLFLDREPENQAVVMGKVKAYTNTQELRRDFITSDEFRIKNQNLNVPTLLGNEPPMNIEEVRSESEMQSLFEHIRDSWQHLGTVEPYWSVATSEQFKMSNINNTRNSFYQIGQGDVERFLRTLERNKFEPASFRSCLEYGCGVGRIVRWLSEKFERVYGYDISQPHLQIAERYLQEEGVRNVTLCQVERIQDVMSLPQVDAVYSVIVLQHNPPPIIEFIVRGFIRALTTGGVAFFQVPTYQLGYTFSLKDYLANEGQKHDMEIHVLSQRKIFEIAREEGAKVIEVLEDGCTGLRYKEVSNSFLIQKA